MIKLAQEFATYAHNSIGQIRKYTGEPYVVHPIAVANLVSEFTNDEEIIIAALLHDVVEDTPYSIDDIRKLFGLRVASIVDELTDTPKNIQPNRALRKALDRKRLAQASVEAKMIKLADIYDNIKSIEDENPEFAKIYMSEKRLMLEVLEGVNEVLYIQVNSIIENYFVRNTKKYFMKD